MKHVYAVGCPVHIGDGLPATVEQVALGRNGRVEYEVLFYIDGTPETAWLHAVHVRDHPDEESELWKVNY